MPLIFAQVGESNGSVFVPLQTVNQGCPAAVLDVVQKRLLPALDLRKPGKKSHKYEKYLMSSLIDAGVLYIVISDGKEDSDLAASIGFLEEVKNEWQSRNRGSQRGNDPSARDISWPKYLEGKLSEWSTRRKSERMKELQKDVKEVKEIMKDNMELLIQRQERIDTVMDKTEQMQVDSFQMKSGATTLRKKLWWKNLKLLAVIAFCVVLILAIIGIVIWQVVK